MGKTLTKSVFGTLSAEAVASMIASDKCADLLAAHYRFQTKMGALEEQFEAKASQLRNDYLHEVEEIQSS
jgi:hypothetical protein